VLKRKREFTKIVNCMLSLTKGDGLCVLEVRRKFWEKEDELSYLIKKGSGP